MVDPKAPSPAPAPKGPLLNLDALMERPTVRIVETEYELRLPDELSILEHHRLLTLGRRVEALEALDDPTDAQEAEYDRTLRAICQQVLLAPAEVLAGLTTPQRAAIALTFSQLWLLASLRATRDLIDAAKAQTPTPESPTTGASSSPPSAGPTEAVP